MAGVRVKSTKREAVHERVRKGLCLIGGCDRAEHSRGLCEMHFQQFYRTLVTKSDEERLEFEAEMIKEGMVLASGEKRRIRCANVFAQA